jgi:hypothetical protein
MEIEALRDGARRQLTLTPEERQRRRAA